jgi:DNA-binding protein
MKDMTISTDNEGDYLKDLEAWVADPSSKRCVLSGQGRNINTLVNVALAFRDHHAKNIKIDDISIGTVKGLPVLANDYPKNMSFMKIMVTKREIFKE